MDSLFEVNGIMFSYDELSDTIVCSDPYSFYDSEESED
ncbi:hypothetical protein [Salmonella phage SE131]|uniref:Uncharacterized protein n=1 Tax=Salmonella phage SE131 TaxID=2081631 RepID=A0A2P1CAG0_9CAUD|nr:hypothetical protein PQC35_gp099 [Salmonella phage SE131]AVJ48200.1 hypothetical protein [Salmonella phage SE131]